MNSTRQPPAVTDDATSKFEEVKMKLRMKTLALALVSAPALAQTPIPQPAYQYAGGVLGTYNYAAGGVGVPNAHQYQFGRVELGLTLAPGSTGIVRSIFTDVYGADGSAYAYGMTTLMQNHGAGLANGDYVRVQGGTGPNIARKTAVRGDAGQWAVWGQQINLGPGAKAAIWITGDNPQLEGRQRDDVPNIIVVDSAVNPGVVLQWNANADATGALLRVFRGGQVTFEVLADGTLRARRLEVMP